MNPISGAAVPPTCATDGVVVVDVRDPTESLSSPPGDPVPGVRRIAPESHLLDENVRRAAPQPVVFELSAKTGEGFAPWIDYLHTLL
jgi:hypothetical protein